MNQLSIVRKIIAANPKKVSSRKKAPRIIKPMARPLFLTNPIDSGDESCLSFFRHWSPVQRSKVPMAAKNNMMVTEFNVMI
jgi:peptide deformylase